MKTLLAMMMAVLFVAGTAGMVRADGAEMFGKKCAGCHGKGLPGSDATVDNERCLACHLTLRPQFFQDLKLSNQVMFCESCGRILYYIPPVAVEDDGGTPSAVGQA